jgi:serine/threonine protein kinase
LQFIDSTGSCKIADFGLARILTPAAMVSLTGETGSYLWMAPEVIRHEPYDARSDSWSYGVLLVELLTQQKPYSNLYLTPVQVAIQVCTRG